jgi:hypothetical protein
VKVYCISGSTAGGNDGATGLHVAYRATKREAEAYLRDLRKDDPDTDCDIEPTEIGPGRQGIVDALNDLIAWTCLNEH